MAEITLDRAVALLSSERQKDRTDGLAGLYWDLRTSKPGLTKHFARFEAYPTAEQAKHQIVRGASSYR